MQLGHTVDFGLGEGNYRLIVDTTSSDFSNVAGNKKERLSAALISFDQQLGDVIGFWIRFALNDIFAITGDVQYMKDLMKEGDSPKGWIFGLRMTAEF